MSNRQQSGKGERSVGRNDDVDDFDIVSDHSVSVSNIFKITVDELKVMFDKSASDERSLGFFAKHG